MLYMLYMYYYAWSCEEAFLNNFLKKYEADVSEFLENLEVLIVVRDS